MKKKTIEIKGAKGGFKVYPNSCKAQYHDKITWQSQLPFVVFFGYRIPLDKKIFSNSQPTGTVQYDAVYNGPKKFKYVVCVYRNGKIHFKDPELDIQP